MLSYEKDEKMKTKTFPYPAEIHAPLTHGRHYVSGGGGASRNSRSPYALPPATSAEGAGPVGATEQADWLE